MGPLGIGIALSFMGGTLSLIFSDLTLPASWNWWALVWRVSIISMAVFVARWLRLCRRRTWLSHEDYTHAPVSMLALCLMIVESAWVGSTLGPVLATRAMGGGFVTFFVAIMSSWILSGLARNRFVRPTVLVRFVILLPVFALILWLLSAVLVRGLINSLLSPPIAVIAFMGALIGGANPEWLPELDR